MTNIIARAHNLPDLALSIRQPWAHAVAAGWKDIENRDWRRPSPGLSFRGRFAIHASTGMTQDEYHGACSTFRHCGAPCPPPHELVRGAIIGIATVTDIVKESDSPWFFGRLGLVITDAVMIEPIPCAGALGFFKWRPSGGALTPPAKWMLPKAPQIAQPPMETLL